MQVNMAFESRSRSRSLVSYSSSDDDVDGVGAAPISEPDDNDRFPYNECDVNVFFEKVLFGVGNIDPQLKKFGKGLRKACEENNLLQVIRGTLHLAVLYQAEKKRSENRAEGVDDKILKNSKSRRQRKSKKRRIESSSSEKKAESDDETLKKSKSRRQRRSKKRRIESSSENVTDDEGTLKKKKVLKKAQQQRRKKHRRFEDSTHDDSGSNEDKLPKAKSTDEQSQSEYHPDDDDDKQSISSDSTVLFSMRKTNRQRQGKDVIVVKEELPSPMLPEDIEIDPDSADSCKDSLLNIEDFAIVEPAEGSGISTTNTGQTQRNKHTCHICRKGFRFEAELKRHLRVHTGERPFPCPHPGCGKKFKEKIHMTRHLLLHSGKKPFKCDFPGCSTAFPTPDQLRKHKNVHTQERPFWCPCGKQFKDKCHFKRHERICSNAKPDRIQIKPESLFNSYY